MGWMKGLVVFLGFERGRHEVGRDDVEVEATDNSKE